jgi:branched-chain amino acid transport system substrate-binding protein
MSKRSRLVKGWALAAAGLLALGACSSSAERRRAALKEVPLKVGVLLTTSGKGGDLAQAVLGASKLAADDAAKNKVKIEIVQADYAGDPNLVPKAVADLRAGSDAIVVATDDPAVLPSLDPITDIPVIHTLLASGIADDRENVFTVSPTAAQQATRLVDYLGTNRKYKRIALITDSTPFGEDGRTAVTAALSQAGITPAADLRFDPGGDIHTPVAAAGQRDAEALVIWVDSPGEAARIVVETQKMGFGFQIALSGNLATSTFAKNASAQVTPVAFRDGMLSVGTWAGPWFNLQRIISFFERFQTDNSAQAPVQAAGVYDAVAVLASAARERSSATASDLITALEGTKDFEGAGVPITFTPNDHVGIDDDDLVIYGYTKDQDSAGGAYFPDVDTGGGFFTIVSESLRLPERYRFLTART